MQLDLNETDLALIHALQVRPRASWAELAVVLGAAASTLARRWERLTAEGVAWVTAYPRWSADSPWAVALVEIDCVANNVPAVVAVLERDSRILTIEQAASGRDLILTVATRSFADLSELVIDELAAVPGVASTRTHLVAQLHGDGTEWRLDALDRHQLHTLTRSPDPRGPSHHQTSLLTMPESNTALVEALARNGRASAVELAAELDRPPSTVRRQLSALLRSGALTFRCEVAQAETRWAVLANWWCQVPEEHRPTLVRALRSQRHVRLSATLAGATNFLVTMWAHSPEDILGNQHWLETQVPSLRIADVAITMRTRKRMGWILDRDGRATGEVYPSWPERRALAP